MLEQAGGRKFVACMATLACCTALCAGGFITGGVFSGVVIAVVGAYMAANVSQKVWVQPGAAAPEAKP